MFYNMNHQETGNLKLFFWLNSNSCLWRSDSPDRFLKYSCTFIFFSPRSFLWSSLGPDPSTRRNVLWAISHTWPLSDDFTYITSSVFTAVGGDDSAAPFRVRKRQKVASMLRSLQLLRGLSWGRTLGTHSAVQVLIGHPCGIISCFCISQTGN